MSEKDARESLVTTWAEAQQQLLKNWLDTVQKFGGTPTRELWTKTVDVWQSSVQETLQAQAKWIQQWTETLANAKGTPEELRELAREGREYLQRWTDAQQELWQGWFTLVRGITSRSEPGAGAQAGGDLVQLWQDSARKMIETQTALLRRWTGGITGTGKES